MIVLQFIRCFLFDLLYFTWTILCCVILLPTFLLPQKLFNKTVKLYFGGIYVLERLILNLKYEIRGLEHLPKDGSYMIASKHQSTYETLKYFLLFPQLMIAMKKELMNVPIWGWYPRKMGCISIDRGSASKALKSLYKGVDRLKAEGKNLLIFPQGTRVPVGATVEEYPYKSGMANIYKNCAIQIVPIAINAGYYWPKNSFLKKSGTVVFEILPTIEIGRNPKTLMTEIENLLETHSDRLMKEALHSNTSSRA